jgi:hypothetical protein
VYDSLQYFSEWVDSSSINFINYLSFSQAITGHDSRGFAGYAITVMAEIIHGCCIITPINLAHSLFMPSRPYWLPEYRQGIPRDFLAHDSIYITKSLLE